MTTMKRQSAIRTGNRTRLILTGALGSFNFYAAIGLACFSLDVDKRLMTVEVKGIWVYVKDNYTFSDLRDERSQYLGHWNVDYD